MRFRPRIFGAAVGFGLALIALNFGLAFAPKPGPMLSESGGAIRELVIHYVAGDLIALPVYQDFLPQLPADVVVHVVCPDSAAFDELTGRIPLHSCQLEPLITAHPMTVWSRDRWIALGSSASEAATTLLTPRDEDAADVWPQRAGDARTALDIADHSRGAVVTRPLGLFFDGGDLLADGSKVFGTRALVDRNLNRTVATRQQLLLAFKRALGTDLTLLDNPPHHHAGMYMMSAGDRIMLVGDPSLGRAFYSASFPELPGGPDFSEETQEQFDSVARQLERMNYHVVRMPTLLAPDAKTYLTYVNVITDRREGHRTVYMPIYRGAEPMNAAAAAIWRGLGFDVRPIDCTSTYRHYGTLHCLVNVLRRDG